MAAESAAQKPGGRLAAPAMLRSSDVQALHRAACLPPFGSVSFTASSHAIQRKMK